MDGGTVAGLVGSAVLFALWGFYEVRHGSSVRRAVGINVTAWAGGALIYLLLLRELSIL